MFFCLMVKSCLPEGQNGAVEKMKKYTLFLLLFSLGVYVIADENGVINVPFQDNTLGVNAETGEIKNLTYKTIEDIQNSNLFGSIIDVIFPNQLINCYIFVFKKGGVVYQIAALPEDSIQIKNLINPLEEIDLTQFFAIGYYGINYLNREDVEIFHGPRYRTPFDFLHEIKPQDYASIDEIEKLFGINLDIVSVGGFLSPFYLYRYCSKDGVLEVLATPSENKNESFFTGGWSFIYYKDTL